MRYAEITWQEETPESAAYGDVYFMRGRGRAECEYVFLQGNGLPQRFQEADAFTIGETGFGTGLNFLHTWQRFEETAPEGARLTFISLEQHPLRPEDIRRVHAEDTQLSALVDALLAQYPLPVAGWHRLVFGRVTLLLGLGEASAMLADFDASVDAWYLDGFAPAKNPDMWRLELFAELARLSASGATLASFTAAGDVRRGLEAAGFAIERRTGFAGKRHMTVGRWHGARMLKRHRSVSHVLVVGGGIAGASVAHALAEHHCKVTLLERNVIAGGASGNPSAVLYPQLTMEPESSRFGWSLAAYALMQRRVPGMLSPAHYAQPGMLKTPKDAKEETRLRTACEQLAPEVVRYIAQEEASALLGVPVLRGGAWFPQGTWLRPAALCHALLAHPGVTVQQGITVTAIETAEAGVKVTDTAGTLWEADAVVLANGMDAVTFLPEWRTRLRPSMGQISQVPAQHIAQMPRAILCHRGYLIPCGDSALIGATYTRDSFSDAVTEAGHAANAAEAALALPGFFAQQNTNAWQGRTSLRATSYDRMPVVGEAQPRVWVTAGHGSRGMLSAPLAADILAAQMTGDIVPASRSLLQALDPLR